MFSSIVLIVFLLAIFNSTPNVIASWNHADPDQCSSPSETRIISTDPSQIKYNVTTINVPKGACVKFVFVNLQDMAHDFNVDPISADNFDGIHIHLDNNTAGENGTNWDSQNVQLPNKDLTVDFFCTIPGHRDSGMDGKLVIGSGSASPGFEVPVIFAGFIIIGTIIVFKRKNK